MTCWCVLVCAAMHTISVKIGGEKCCNEEGAIVRLRTIRRAGTLGPRSRHLPASVVVHANEIKRVVGCAAIRLFERAHTNAACHYDILTRLIPRS